MITIAKSWRDLGKLGYGNGGAADSPWTRQGIYVQGAGGLRDAVNTGGPGIDPARRPAVENTMLKQPHEFVEVNWVCLHCHLLAEGHDRLMEALRVKATAKEHSR